MAYTIISQNNTTTTLSDENGNVITVPARVTLATSTDYTIIKVNNNSVDLEDGDGKIIRGVPACVVLAGGGGGGDQHNLGYYATQAALEEAYPTAEAGDWAIVGATDTVWIWDTDNEEWIDSDQKGQVTSVNGQTGDVVIPTAPTYTAGNGIDITSDVISTTVPMLIETAETNIPAFGPTVSESVAFGKDIYITSSFGNPLDNSFAAGLNVSIYGSKGTAVGNESYLSAGNSSAFGYNTRASGDGVAVGCNIQAGAGGVALGYGGTSRYAGDASTFVVCLTTSNYTQTFQYNLLGIDGKIPVERINNSAIIKYNSLPTASLDFSDMIVQYVGATDANYTNGYFYKCSSTTTAPSSAAVNTVQTTVDPSLLTIDVTTLETKLASRGVTIDTMSMVYFYCLNGTQWAVYVDGVSLGSPYPSDLTEYGVTYTGTPASGDWIYLNYTPAVKAYVWTQTNVQPGSSGNFLPLTGGTLTGDLTMQNSKVQLYNSSILGSFWLESADSGYLRIGKSATASNDDLFINTGTVNQRSIAFGDTNGGRIGSASAKFEYVYTQKLSNGSDIAVPNVAGTMAVMTVNTTGTLAVADWSSNTQTVTVSGVKADSVVFVSPAPASASDYASAGILCTAQAADSLTFTCTTTPTNAITVNVVCM